MNAATERLGLDELTWIDVAAHLARDPRLIIPVGALEQHGPHLPLGTNLLIAERIATDLSNTFGVLRAPAMHYGVNVNADTAFAGTATLLQKTLHRALNELLASWESHGIGEFIIITAHRYEPHLDALATLITDHARVRVISIWDVDIADLLQVQSGPLHAGEAETSVMLFLYPDLVRMDRARNYDPSPRSPSAHQADSLPVPPPESAGVVGYPTAASVLKGEAIYQRLLGAIRGAVFTPSSDLDSDTV